MAMIGPDAARAPPWIAASNGRLAHVQVALDVFDHDDGVVHDEPDREHDGEQREQVEREADDQHQEHRADRARSESRRPG